MSGNIRYPNITGASVPEQIAQIRSFLYQLVDQLNYELSAGSATADGGNQAAGKIPFPLDEEGNLYYELEE